MRSCKEKLIVSVLVLFSTSVQAAVVLDHFMLIQPIRICDDGGNNCASAPLSASHTSAVYQQAGVAAVYLPTNQVNNSSMLTVDGVADVNIVGNGQSSNANTVNVWFADSLNAPPGSTLFGEA